MMRVRCLPLGEPPSRVSGLSRGVPFPRARTWVLALSLMILIPATVCHAMGIPETAITRTHLVKDIQRSTITAAVGMEFFKGSLSGSTEGLAYAGEALFGYFGYSPFDWLELGIAVHNDWLRFVPAVEAKIDVVDLFTDSSRISCLLAGGIGYVPDDSPWYHGGAAVNFRVNQRLQLCLGAGSDSWSQALSLQAGVYVVLLDWLGLSTNFKLVCGPQGMEPMLSVAPLAVRDLRHR